MWLYRLRAKEADFIWGDDHYEQQQGHQYHIPFFLQDMHRRTSAGSKDPRGAGAVQHDAQSFVT